MSISYINDRKYIAILAYMMVPSSAALQNMNGRLGAVAIRLTRPAWQPNTCMEDSPSALRELFTSWTRILASAAPLTTRESPEFGRN